MACQSSSCDCRSFPTFDANESLMDTLIKLSCHFGADPAFVLAGGGNTSAKDGDKLYVKGSGSSLAKIDASGFVEMDRPAITELLKRDLGSDVIQREEQFKNAIMAARLHPELGQRPSVECVLHNLLPCKYIIHTHATLVNMITCCVDGEKLTNELFGDEALWIPYVDPGFILAQTLDVAFQAWTKRTGRACPPAVIMQKHGLIVCGDTPEEIRQQTELVMGKIQAKLAATKAKDLFGTVEKIEGERAKGLINIIGPALRGLLAESDTLKIVTFDDSEPVLSLVAGAQGKANAELGPMIPDQIVYCKSFPLWFETSEAEEESLLVERLRQAIQAHTEQTNFPPYVVLVKGLGLFAAGDNFAGADTIRQVYVDAIKVMSGAKRLGGINPIGAREREFIEDWEVENYRRKVAAGNMKQQRATNKVALITGAAQGFGLEIAQDFVAQGAHAVLSDMNVVGAAQAAAALVEQYGDGRATGIAINVTSMDSVAEAIHQTVRLYGGFDVFVSNAGVLKAASVKTQLEKDFDFVTNVNYKGFFLCTQKAAFILATQRRARATYWSDIVQINSKSGLQGSNRNGSYAGSKFGGIGLVQSFAMELVEDGIKVNAICPGNFFDGPLWSDPNNGLFMQYLGTGKVPGAQTVADVKKFYEAKVPMNRGCTTPDVMKAVYYLMEQQYETGQALPVTGGQVMLK